MAVKRLVLDGRYAQVLEGHGVDVRQVLRAARLPEATFLSPAPTMTPADYYAFMEALGEFVPDEETVVTMASSEGVEQFSPPVFAAWCSPDGRTCVERLALYKRLVGPMALTVSEARGELRVGLAPVDLGGGEQSRAGRSRGRGLPRFAVETEVVLLTHLVRTAARASISPLRVTMREPSAPGGAVARFLGTVPQPGDADAVVFTSTDMSRPFVSRNDAMWGYVEPELRRRLSDLEADELVSLQVRSVLAELLPAGRGSMGEVARALAVSPRTLQRRLGEEGTTFLRQRDRTRELLARHYLAQPRMTSTDVAYLLGYTELNSFLRAFKGWTGMTVGQARARAARGRSQES